MNNSCVAATTTCLTLALLTQCFIMTLTLNALLVPPLRSQTHKVNTNTHSRVHDHTLPPTLSCSRDFSSCFKQTCLLEHSWRGERKPISHQTSYCVADNTFKEPFFGCTLKRSHPHAHINTFKLRRAHKGS